MTGDEIDLTLFSSCHTQDDDMDNSKPSPRAAKDSCLSATKRMEAIDAEEKKLWDAAVMEMGPMIKIILQQLSE